MIKTWLAHQDSVPCKYTKFSLTKLDEIDPTKSALATSDLIAYLGEILVQAHAHPMLIETDLKAIKLLLEDADILGLSIVKDYLEKQIQDYLNKMVLPTRTIVKIGNFSEVLAVQCMVDFESYTIPLYKLRYREKRDWAMKLTDMFLLKKLNDAKIQVCYGEVKTRSQKRYTKQEREVAIEAYDSLTKNDALDIPEIIRFIRTILIEQEKFDYASMLADIQLGTLDHEKHNVLFLVHDTDYWKDEILDELENHNIDPDIPNLNVKVLRLRELRKVIDATYENTWKGVVASHE